MNDSEQNLPADSFETRLSQVRLSGLPQDRDSVLYECGKASVAADVSAMKSRLRRCQFVSIASTLVCVLLSSVVAFGPTHLQSTPALPQAGPAPRNELDSLKRLLVNRQLPERSTILCATSSFEDATRVSEWNNEMPAQLPADLRKPLRAGDIHDLL